jgi:hypothetical protein
VIFQDRIHVAAIDGRDEDLGDGLDAVIICASNPICRSQESPGMR